MKILGIVIVYHPTPDVADHIASYLDSLDTLLVWDNTPGKACRIPLPDGKEDKIRLIHKGENAGIAVPLNEAVRYAIAHEFTHLLTMDQDSTFSPGDFARYLDIVAACQDASYFQFSPSRLDSPRSRHVGEWTPAVEEIPDTITSGTITPVSVLKKIGPFNELFVIDAIDTEYCLRVHRAGGKIGIVRSIHLQHRLGHPLTRRFLCWKMHSFNYPPARTYYIVRNFMYLKHLYPEYNSRYIMKLFVYRRFIRILCIESDKWAKMKALLCGFYQGMTRQMNRDLYYEKIRR